MAAAPPQLGAATALYAQGLSVAWLKIFIFILLF
jgi:hypothetical protein